ncbi:flagellar hook-associated protein FlgL [Janthinobacterium agaricidamnosum]|uniref:Flagellar hook-associated protein 3 n=1 Tax=Janthinobacterium agaricidamnosum NBRC 102515 = DSM 9628 TaxID=1349767 RepID=W0V2Q8_9BURK|nr:flagellar hook-associated protein FlgL [Janthinobacterium agaricidamnosum]CDG81885.1 flagellar hook-associated protein 3 [Janthinobacterium agaricidamnosum NBRC 102515 = DSM 9628]
MRISTKSIYDTGSNQLNNLQSALNRTQMQMSTNRRNLTPADDPIASARALEVSQSQSINNQLVTNRSNAKNFLSQEDIALGNTTNLLSDVKDLIVKAGNGSMKDVDRGSLATELEGRLNDLLGIANTADGAGGYLFSGYKSTTQPYTLSPTGAVYQGDQGQRTLQVGSTRTLATSDTGSNIFDNNMTGNGKFTTSAAAANYTNGGSGIISGGTVTNASALTGHKYSIDFTVTPTGIGTETKTTYIVTDTTLGVTVPNPATPTDYVAGQAISFDGQQVDVKGKPANGDKFNTEPSAKESIFTTIKNLIGVLRSPSEGEAGQAKLTNGLNAAHDIIDTAYDNVLSVRSEVGSRLKELDYLDSSGDDLNIQYESTLNDLQGLDVVKTISLFTQQQTTLQAAQKSFTAVSGLSLFNYIN